MGKIRVLSDNLVSKIAAGEIVERPASVVKELVENSIDAGSKNIRIELESGGKKLIEVSDDGEGMSRDEALLSLERHATSKIKDINDLFSVKSLGFRGEAIPSIASVSRFKLTTRTNEEVIGSVITVEGGKIRQVEETGCPPGTTVQVKNLFYNTPVRLKFMRKIETELSNVLDIVQREAMSRPGIGFEVLHGGKTLLRLSRKDNLPDRLTDIFPNAELHSASSEAEGIRVSGFISSPLDTRSTTQKLFTYINLRAVRDKFLTRIIIDSYGKMLEKRKFPQGALFLEIPAQEVDVNVHPTKNEVRFRNQRLIADLIRASVLKMLREAPWIKSYKQRVENSHSGYIEGKDSFSSYETTRHLNRPKRGFAEEAREIYFNDTVTVRNEIVSATHSGHDYHIAQNDSSPKSLFENGGLYSSLRIIGQIKELYIVCASENGMVLVDQHAAHERINYEKIKSAYTEDKEPEVQELLVPEVIEFTPYESSLIEKHKEEFETLGLRVEEFGNNSFLIRSVPALLKNVDSVSLLKDVIYEIASTGKEESISEKIDLVIATMACHSSIRAKFELNLEEMKALLKELDHMKFPHSCPHGRPVAVELSYYDIERMFKRV